jgi:predicted amidohydrolase
MTSGLLVAGANGTGDDHAAGGRASTQQCGRIARIRVTFDPREIVGRLSPASRPNTPSERGTCGSSLWQDPDGIDQARLRLDHSGAFALGAATNIAMLLVEQLGIVTLTRASAKSPVAARPS